MRRFEIIKTLVLVSVSKHLLEIHPDRSVQLNKHSGNIHSFSTASSIVGRGGAGAYLQQSMGERRGTSWTGRHTLIHTSKGNLERPINLTGMSLDCGRKPEYPVRTHACTGRTCKLHAERPRPEVKPRTFLLQGNSDTNCATLQPTMEIFHY
ncbi:hypothetical protein ILYODFUR_034988 [Ilyodon furcidens]|uniref:Secreted protein n=1 Tax=Ilyodon furcidens TaxID=33524 RepID=A0ABV0U0C8_9TELE